ncbi:hypothetical protein ACQCX2_17525 [Propionibacteriaceae bacterium Y1700]|uniref:hypothetical protein n=1 Tax=Microlunatus sp. Y1700 TaxID=3418487 RepID=UPI003DA76360
MTVTLGTLVLHPQEYSPTGWQLDRNGLDGWYDVAGSKSVFEGRPQAHGAFVPGPDFRSPAAPLLRGRFQGTPAEAVAAKMQLAALAGQAPGLTVLRVTDDAVTSQRMVSIRTVDVDDDHGRGRFNFAVDCLAPDPRRYGLGQELIKELPFRQGGNIAVNPSAAVDLYLWSGAVNGGPYNPVRVFSAGSWGARVVAPTAAESVVVKNTVPLSLPVPAHTVSVLARASRVRPVRMTCTWLSSSEVFQTATTDQVMVGPEGHRFDLKLDPFPTGATQLVVAVDSTEAEPFTAGEWLEAQRVMVGVTTTYADGDTPGWTWTGTPGRSTSLDNEQMIITNIGTADIEPRFTLYGPMPDGFRIIEVETGRQIIYRAAITGSAIVDPTEGVVLVNGLPKYGLIRYQWPKVPGGTSRRYIVDQPTRVPISVKINWASGWW